MDIVEIIEKAKIFSDVDIKKAYTVICLANEWMKETGGTLDELLSDIEKSYGKKEVTS